MLGTILIVILVLALVGALPRWSHSKKWGYYPTSGLGLSLSSLSFSCFSAVSEVDAVA